MGDFADQYEELSWVIDWSMTSSDEAVAGKFEEVAFSIVEFQLRWNPAYARFCKGKKFADWQSIPAVPTAAFKDPANPVSCFPVGEAERYFETSGTTGEKRGRHYFFETSLYSLSIGIGWARAGLPYAEPRFWLPGLGDDSSLAFMLELLSGRKAGEMPAADRPSFLMGTALSFLHLFESGCGRLAEGSWAMETGGYKGSGREIPKADLYAMFEDELGVPQERIINEYGMTELSSQFYARGVDGLHEGPRWARAVVRSPETGAEVQVGEAGYLTIYDLANLGSVMAVATQDIAVRREGGAFQLLGRDPAAIPRGCSRAADEFLSSR